MASTVDMSLDDIIKKNRAKARGGSWAARRGRAPAGSFRGGRMPGPVRRGPLFVNKRSSRFSSAKPAHRIRSLPWQHDLLEDSIKAAGITGVEVGARLYVSNLDTRVSNEDIRELFSEIGELKRYGVHYDKNGRPNGSADVVYVRRSNAFAALKKYNNVLLDGKPMKIEIVGASADMPPISARVNVTGVNGRKKRTVVMTSGPGHATGISPVNRSSGKSRRGGSNTAGRFSDRGGGLGQGRGRRRGWVKKRPIEKSVVELDKELDSYHTGAMQS